MHTSGNSLRGRLSTPQIITNSLRTAIVEGRLRPGEPLRQDHLAEQFDVSHIPVREALRQLESEGWVVFKSNKGAAVSLLSVEEVREIYQIRASLECTALRLAFPSHTPESLLELEQAAQAARGEHTRESYAQRNREFHFALYGICKQRRLLSIIETLHRQGERYLRLKLASPEQKMNSDAEHDLILDACVRGDVNRAVALLEAHLLQSGELVASYLQASPEGTDGGAAVR
jgi:DNA-binding GntR family transcriptional regulator